MINWRLAITEDRAFAARVSAHTVAAREADPMVW